MLAFSTCTKDLQILQDPEYQAPVSQAAAAKPEPQAFGGNGASEPSSAAADAEPSPSAPPPPGPRPASDRPSPAPAPPVQRPGWAPSLAGASAWAQNLGGRAAAAARGAARGGMQGAGRNPAALLFALHVLQLVLALGVVLPVRSWGVRPWQLFQLAAFAAHGAKARAHRHVLSPIPSPLPVRCWPAGAAAACAAAGRMPLVGSWGELRCQLFLLIACAARGGPARMCSRAQSMGPLAQG